MAIIECPGCGGQLSTSAPACPRCQHVPTEEELSLATPMVGSAQESVLTDATLLNAPTKAVRERHKPSLRENAVNVSTAMLVVGVAVVLVTLFLIFATGLFYL